MGRKLKTIFLLFFVFSVGVNAEISRHYERTYPQLSSEERYQLFERHMAKLVEGIPDLKPIWDFQRANPHHHIYFPGGRLRGLIRWMELQLNAGLSPEQVIAKVPPKLDDLSLLDLGKPSTGPKQVADKDLFFMDIKDREGAKAFKKQFDQKTGGDWDILPANFYWSANRQATQSNLDMMVGIEDLQPDGRRRPAILSPRGGLKDEFNGVLRYQPKDYSIGQSPPVGPIITTSPEEWNHLFPNTALRYLRAKLECPWLQPDAEGEIRLKEDIANYSFKPGQLLPDAADIYRMQKNLDKVFIAAGGDLSLFFRTIDEFGLGRLIYNDHFSLPANIHDLDTRTPLLQVKTVSLNKLVFNCDGPRRALAQERAP